jgi:putative ABC transport system permease protein
VRSNSTIPPRLPQRILLRFLRDDLTEEVLGDLEEKFYSTVKNKSLRRAKLNYWYQVFNYLRPFAFRKSTSSYSNQYDMFQSYFRIGWRNLVRQKMYSVIKIGGFALGIAACLLIALFIKDELSYDVQYPADVYRVIGEYSEKGSILKGVDFPAPLAATLKEEFPEVKMTARINPSESFGAGSNEIRRADQEENAHEEGFTFADQELLDILKIPMVFGNPKHALDEPNTIVLSRRKADKFFPNKNPVGEMMVLNNNKAVKVGGVMENFPATSHLQFDFLLTLKGVEYWPGEQNYWLANNYHTYINIPSGTDPVYLATKFDLITKKYIIPKLKDEGFVDAAEIGSNLRFRLQSIRDIHLHSADIDDDFTHGDIRYIWIFGIIAAFILVIACINFINLSTARSANRAKEVGLRKVVGSFRSNLIRQFLTESILFSFLSFLLGIGLAWTALPWFNILAAKSLVFPWHEWWLIPSLILSAGMIGILAGLYPSFYLSAFMPAHVLKGNLSRGSKSSTMRSALVIFQFTASIVLIIGTVIVYRQMGYILTRKAGFEKDQVLLIHGTNTLEKSLRTFKNELLKVPGVKNATVSGYFPVAHTMRNSNSFWKEGKSKEDPAVYAQAWSVDHDYIKTMGMKIVAGRDFSAAMATDSSSVIINQIMAKELGLKDPVGERVQRWGTSFTVIGVVEDFHFESMKQTIGPLAMFLDNSTSIMAVKVNTTDMQHLIGTVSSVWKKFNPKQPIRYTFMDESFAAMYEDVRRTGRIFTSFAALAVVVACLGLFALSAFMTEQRSKEISIRLVLGASVNNIFRLLTQNFLRLVFTSVLIAVPIAWYAMDQWLQDYVYRISITCDVFLLSGAMAVSIAFLTISYQSISAAFINPARNLKAD